MIKIHELQTEVSYAARDNTEISDRFQAIVKLHLTERITVNIFLKVIPYDINSGII